MVAKTARWWRRLGLALLLGLAAACALSACSQDGQFTILGYGVGNACNYDTRIKTVRVPIFENRTFYRGLDFDLTRAIVREIEAKTPYKVVQCDADTELKGVITVFTKGWLLANPLNEIRQGQVTLVAEVSWINLRTGEVLSRPSRRPGQPIEEPPAPAPFTTTPGLNPGAPTAVPAIPGVESLEGAPVLPPQPSDVPKPQPPPVTVTAVSNLIVPELGYSISVAEQQCVDRMAVQIISLMEKPW